MWTQCLNRSFCKVPSFKEKKKKNQIEKKKLSSIFGERKTLLAHVSSLLNFEVGYFSKQMHFLNLFSM